jgi:O-antigen/teichoic acid export membrane protein
LFTFFGKYAISILYGKAFLPAVAPLQVITWYTAFSFLGVARNAWVVCENKQNKLKYIYISSALLNVALNFIFIPWLGATGAAIASLTAQVATTMIVPFFMSSLRQNSIMMLQAMCFKGVKPTKSMSSQTEENQTV